MAASAATALHFMSLGTAAWTRAKHHAMVRNVAARGAAACPFCKAVRPTLAQRCEAAREALLVVCQDMDGTSCSFQLLKSLRSQLERKPGTSFTLQTAQLQPSPEADGMLTAGSLALLLANPTGDGTPAQLAWEYLPLNELSLAYLARLPERRGDPVERLAHFVPYLEHADPLLAADAYLEFAHAPYDVVAKAAPTVDPERLRCWVQDQNVPDDRKGLYGLLLGLAHTERDRVRNAQRLRELIEQPALDLRAGFDGMLAGYLLLEGEAGLELVERRILAYDQAAEGDVRHAVAALRFHQVHARRISHERLAQALTLLLDRPGFTAEIIGDLARLRYWAAIDRVAARFSDEARPDPAVDRAVVGYLLVCPLDEAQATLAELRRRHPQRVAEAEDAWRRLRPAGPN